VTTTSRISGFSGIEINPGDAEYDEARSVFNGMIDRRPAVILRCTSADDVVAVVNYARDAGLPLSVYGGGHSVTGAAVVDDGVVCDMRGMKGITIDADARIARAEAGLNWGEFDAATQEHGLAVTGGRVPDTGIAGLALGSGSGWLERKLGFTCDNLVKAEVVTADGRKVIASADENPELFWGLRGGGGNFGIVTAFHLRLHLIGPMVLGGLMAWPGFMGGEVARMYRDLVAGAPDDFGSALAFITAPPEEFVPEPARGQPAVGMVICWAGDLDEGERFLAPVRAFGPPAGDLVAPMPDLAVQQLIAAAHPPGLRNYRTADFLGELPDEAIDTLVAHGTRPISPFSQVLLIPGGGAISRVADDADAFGERHAPFNTHFLSMWDDPAEDAPNIAYVKDLAAAMKPWTTGAAYLNFIGDEGESRVRSAFGPEKFARLQALKKEWDPQNVFRHNQNIPPA
jgi:FAD/FMN-containing dehydrogenase